MRILSEKTEELLMQRDLIQQQLESIEAKRRALSVEIEINTALKKSNEEIMKLKQRYTEMSSEIVVLNRVLQSSKDRIAPLSKVYDSARDSIVALTSKIPVVGSFISAFVRGVGKMQIAIGGLSLAGEELHKAYENFRKMHTAAFEISRVVGVEGFEKYLFPGKIRGLREATQLSAEQIMQIYGKMTREMPAENYDRIIREILMLGKAAPTFGISGVEEVYKRLTRFGVAEEDLLKNFTFLERESLIARNNYKMSALEFTENVFKIIEGLQVFGYTVEDSVPLVHSYGEALRKGIININDIVRLQTPSAVPLGARMLLARELGLRGTPQQMLERVTFAGMDEELYLKMGGKREDYISFERFQQARLKVLEDYRRRGGLWLMTRMAATFGMSADQIKALYEMQGLEEYQREKRIGRRYGMLIEEDLMKVGEKGYWEQWRPLKSLLIDVENAFGELVDTIEFVVRAMRGSVSKEELDFYYREMLEGKRGFTRKEKKNIWERKKKVGGYIYDDYALVEYGEAVIPSAVVNRRRTEVDNLLYGSRGRGSDISISIGNISVVGDNEDMIEYVGERVKEDLRKELRHRQLWGER